MTIAVEASIIIIAVALVVLIAITLPTILQVRKTAKSAEDLLTTMNRDLDPILKDLRKTTANLEEASAKLREGAQVVAGAMGTLGVVGELVKGTSDLVRGNVINFFGHAANLATGYKTGLKYFFEHLFNKEVKKDE